MPFTGNEIPAFDPSQPVGKRFSVYRWRVPSPDDYTPGRGFYLSSEGLDCDARGSSFRLRLEWANDILRETGHRRLAETSGYFTDDEESETLKPIVARLNHSRGFVPGWTMGNGMASSINYSTIYTKPEDAAIAAHSDAEYDAEKEREHQERERERIEAEDRAEDARKLTAQDRFTLETFVDTHGLSAVLVMLSEVCAAKATHLEENWQDSYSAKPYATLSRRLDKLAADARARGLSHND